MQFEEKQAHTKSTSCTYYSPAWAAGPENLRLKMGRAPSPMGQAGPPLNSLPFIYAKYARTVLELAELIRCNNT